MNNKIFLEIMQFYVVIIKVSGPTCCRLLLTLRWWCQVRRKRWYLPTTPHCVRL